jgi:hypothetical protein
VHGVIGGGHSLLTVRAQTSGSNTKRGGDVSQLVGVTMFRFLNLSSGSGLAAAAATAAIAVAVGSAATASNDIPQTNAGQNVAVVSGFEVTEVRYDTNDTVANAETATVDTVTFTIVRKTQSLAVLATGAGTPNAEVWLQLRGLSSASGNWVECTYASADNAVTCDTSAVAATMTMTDVNEISVVAFDLAAAS